MTNKEETVGYMVFTGITHSNSVAAFRNRPPAGEGPATNHSSDGNRHLHDRSVWIRRMKTDLRAPGWTTVGGVSTRGWATDSGTPLDSDALAVRFAGALSESAGSVSALAALGDVASALEGFFAAVVNAGGTTYLLADGARTVPLYYSTDGVISDRGWIVRDAISAIRDPVTESELLLTRYVTGPETIWSGVHSTRAGEVVALGEDKPTRLTYRDHFPGADSADSVSPAAARSILSAGLDTALDRLDRLASGRPIVVPLSGGYDSRLLAAALVARGRRVIGFTFGRAGHPDVETSREIATALDIEWHHVPYSRADWWQWYHGEACRNYRSAAFGGDALPFLAEWPAVHRLVSEKRIPENAIVCPGHTVATPGERLPAFDGEPSLDDLVETVLRNHYSLWKWDDPEFRRAARGRIRRGLLGERGPNGITNAESAAAAYERWEWRGRMTTFTNGDLRVYDDSGLDWWLPLWDPAYVRAWNRLPLEHRCERRAHTDLAVERYRDVASCSRVRAARTDRTLSSFDRALSLVRHTPVRQFIERDGEWLPPFLAPRAAWGPSTHPLGWYGAVHPDLLDRLPSFESFYSLRTLAATGRLDFSDPTSQVPTDGPLELPTAFE